MKVTDALKTFLCLEEKEGLYQYKIGSIVLWNLYRANYRGKYISNVMGVRRKTKTVSKRLKYSKEIEYFFYSLSRLFKLLIKHENYENAIFANGRLQIKNGVYFDKFTDPVIDASDLSKSFCLFQIPCDGYPYKGCRRHENKIVPLDCLFLFSFILMPFFLFYHVATGGCKEIYRLYSHSKLVVPQSYRDYVFMNTTYMRIRITAFLYKLILKRIGASRVFIGARRGFMDVSYSAHKLKIPVYEFQHGITHGVSDYYSGPSCSAIDPDYFLSFGSMWKGTQFGIDPNRIINIGWAYKDEVILSTKEVIPNSVLFISSPMITFKLLQTAKELSERYSQFSFFIRCHPYEQYTKEQLNVINSTENLFLDDLSKDSQDAICQYQYIVGENSSVVYEALSLGKIVGRLCYNGIESTRSENVLEDGFVYLYGIEDFTNLLSANRKTDGILAYSRFNKEVVNELPLK